MGCKYCTEYEDLPEHIINGKPVGKIFDACIQPDEKGLWHIELPSSPDIGIKFCPYCGRNLVASSNTQSFIDTIKAGKLPPLGSNDGFGIQTNKYYL
jgi:hypothetical protein